MTLITTCKAKIKSYYHTFHIIQVDIKQISHNERVKKVYTIFLKWRY